MQDRNRENPPTSALALRGDERSPPHLIAFVSRVKRDMVKYIGRTCRICGATSPIEKWTLTDQGLKCPACGNVKGEDKK